MFLRVREVHFFSDQGTDKAAFGLLCCGELLFIRSSNELLGTASREGEWLEANEKRKRRLSPPC